MSPGELPDSDSDGPIFNITSADTSHPGKVRTRNEDSLLSLPAQNLWAVADGMGGHQSGDFASQTITNNLALFQQQESLSDSILLLEENVLNSNNIIREKAKKMGPNATIGSTIVCAYIWHNQLFTLWAGDSRLYRYRDSTLQRLTEDHSYVEELVKLGHIEASDAEKHPAANVVLKAVGIDDSLHLDFDCFEIFEGDIYILCSDGLYKDLEEGAMSSLLETNSVDVVQLTNELLSSSLAGGGTDNTSIVALKVDRKEATANV